MGEGKSKRRLLQNPRKRLGFRFQAAESALDIGAETHIIKMKNGSDSCSSVSSHQWFIGRKTAKQPSLCRVAVVFFIAVRVLMGFLDDDCHRVLPHVERNTQRPFPPFGPGSRNSRQLSVLHHLLRGRFIVRDRDGVVNSHTKKNPGYRSSLGKG